MLQLFAADRWANAFARTGALRDMLWPWSKSSASSEFDPAPPSPRWLSLRWKTVLLLSLLLVLAFGSFGYIAGRTLAQSSEAALQESLSQAEVVAESLDSLVVHVRQQVAGLAGHPGFQGDSQEQRRTLRDAFNVMSSVESIWLLDPNGSLIWREVWNGPGVGEEADDPGLYVPAAVRAVEIGEVTLVHPSWWEVRNAPVAVVAAPVIDESERAIAVVVAAIRLTYANTRLVSVPDRDSSDEFYLVDEQGTIVMNPMDERISYHDEHWDLLGESILEDRPGVEVHASKNVDDHVVAFVPLDTLPGGVIFEEHGDEVLAIPQRLRRTLLILGSTAVGLASVIVWLYVRHMVQPVLVLRTAAERIARGQLDAPVRVDRQDELGELARAFESMREGLRESEERRVNWEQELEDRVKSQAAHVRQLLGRVISAQEAERKRLARELHDGATQMVTALLLQVEGMASALPADSRAARESAPAARDYAMNALEEMRRVILDLRLPALDDLGLVAALREYAEQRLGEAGIDLEFRVTGEPSHWDSDVEIELYRVIQEAINNVANHSEAERAAVTLEFRTGHLRAEVRDYGRGFLVEETLRTTPGVGIVGMLERAEILGGRLAVLSNPDEGTRVTLEVPVDTG